MGIRTIIPGPPGTGKTHRLVNHYLEKEINEFKTEPEKIIYIAFGNAGVDEADKRIKHSLLYVSTMHRLGTRECKIITNKQLLTGKNWRRFKNYPNHEQWQNMSFETKVDSTGAPIYEDIHMRIITYAKAKKISIQEAAIQLDKHVTTDLFLTEQLAQDLKTFKKETKMVEFSDMISLFIGQDKMKDPSSQISDIEAVFLDEAQDLSPAQWDMFFYIEKHCKRSYIAGDDDQTIYTFQGADPKIFMELGTKNLPEGWKAIKDEQVKSRRVPRKIYAKALEVLSQISKRLPKNWEPRDAEGEVIENYYLEDIDFTEGNWMLLAQTNDLLSEIGKHFYDLGLRFSGKVNKKLPNKILEGYRVWTNLNNGGTVPSEDAKIVYEEFLNYHAKHVSWGYSSGNSLDKVETVNLKDLQKNHGLLVTGSWEQLHIADETKDYIKLLLNKGDTLLKDSRIKLLTLHGSKGKECDNVVLCLDYGTETQIKPYLEACRDPDSQHRLIFVGITRAKQRLYILPPLYDQYYTIGHPVT